jgi:hypothetical protein
MGLPGLERVVEAPELEQGAEVERRRAGAEAHGAVEGALEDRQPSIGLQADQEQLAGLVGGEGEARSPLREPCRRRQYLHDLPPPDLGHHPPTVSRRGLRRMAQSCGPRRASRRGERIDPRTMRST